MGVLINAVNTLDGRPRAPKSPFSPELETNPEEPGTGGPCDSLVKNFNFGTKVCPVVSELRQMGEGITLGDLR